MQEQNLLHDGPLLNAQGDLAEAGYAFGLVKTYSRDSISASKWRIKEWDYYYIGNKDYGIALTVDDNGYMSMASVSVLDFRIPGDVTKSPIGWFPFGKLKLPRTSEEGDIVFENEKAGFSMKFLHEGGKRHLVCMMKGLGAKKETFRCDVYLEPTNPHSMVIATPFEKKGHFYYNQKINNLKASGYAKLGEKTYDFNQDSYGVLDWGRGVWTYRNTWYWSSAQARQHGHLIGWNLGYGFGDTSKASENMLFVDEKAYKLGDVIMDIPLDAKGRDDFLKPWSFRSKDGAIEMTFTPVYDRHADTNVLLIRSNQHQVFGTFTGRISAGDEDFFVNDMPGFAEKVYNKW